MRAKKNKNKRREILFNFLALLALVGYIVFAFMLDSKLHKGAVCTEIDIRIHDSATVKLITPIGVLELLDSARLNPVGKNLDSLSLKSIEDQVRASSYVSRVEVYMVSGGVMVVDMHQVEPVVRINMQTGYDFYLTDELLVLQPTKLTAKDVLVVNGNYQFDFANDYFGNILQKNNTKEHEKLEKLTNFVKFIDNDEFLSSLIAQIWLDSLGDITLIPMVSDQKIHFGPLSSPYETEDYEQRLLKLKKFYNKSFKSGWWQSATTVDLRFAGQVIVK